MAKSLLLRAKMLKMESELDIAAETHYNEIMESELSMKGGAA